ncbi:type II toxin-antitoxin system RelE/ParE family toxin [Deinococcus roseus]|uniref:Addiction module toxin RelE n=1 Tax=Deinococcus roseus TaxID=392414 RepID=A0ABQ2DGR6_9DEIO|nr:type II toxin-antitoxin system RelE/ParE family toxin [Deinococcus roseus]GGJ55123.1 hypothetical protein GCM10008938_46560 [Deinococcus roseus]
MTTWVWELYRDANGDIPQELQEHFYQLLKEKPQGIKPSLSDKQANILRTDIKFLCDFHPASLSHKMIDYFKEDGFFELKFIHDNLCYRYTFTMKDPQTFVFLDVFEKRYNGATKDRDKARTIKRLGELRSKIKAEKAAQKAVPKSQPKSQQGKTPRKKGRS